MKKEFLVKLVHQLNENYKEYPERHFRMLTKYEAEKYLELLNNRDDEFYEPYATDGKNIVSIYDAYGVFSRFLFTYIDSIEEE